MGLEKINTKRFPGSADDMGEGSVPGVEKNHSKLQKYMVSLQSFLVLGNELMASCVLNVDSTNELPHSI